MEGFKMKIDLDYLASLLAVFLDSEEAHVDFDDMEKSGIEVEKDDYLNDKFLFHIQIAIDNQLIGKRTGSVFNLEDVGISQYLDGTDDICNTPLRLTQAGHDFACTLNNKEVLTKLKTELKDAPFKTLFEGGQKLLQHIMAKKLDSILE
jgi:hypothetical protein